MAAYLHSSSRATENPNKAYFLSPPTMIHRLNTSYCRRLLSHPLLFLAMCSTALMVMEHHTASAQAFDPTFAQIGTLYGTVRDAVTGKPITNATISLAGRTTQSDSTGYYVLRDIPTTLKADFYASRRFGRLPFPTSFTLLMREGMTDVLTTTAANYAHYSNNQITINPQERTELNITLNPQTPSTNIGGYRIVLTWQRTPVDLDTYLLTPPINDTTWKIAYYRRGYSTQSPFATLDIDRKQGFGPETLTIRRFFSGTYKYSVENSGAKSDPNTRPLGGCGATVEVYSDSGLVRRFVVPDVGGRLLDWWHVFTIDGATGRITPVNVLDSNDIEKFRWNTAIAAAPASGVSTVVQKHSAKTTADDPFSAQWNFGNGSTDTGSGTISSGALTGITSYTTSGTYDVNVNVVAKNGFITSKRKPAYITTFGAVTDAIYGMFSTGEITGTIGSDNDIGLERALEGALNRFSTAAVGIWINAVTGIVADTASRLVIIAAAPDTLTPVTIALDGEGTIAAINRPREQSKLLQLRSRRPRQFDPTVAALYTPPPSLRLPAGVSSTTFTIRITVGTLGTLALPLKLVRPPVVLVHDAWSDPSAWERGGFASYLRQLGYSVFSADYSSASVGGFNPRPSTLPSIGIAAVTTAITQARTAFREQGIVVQRVDVIAHGLGGLMTRGFLQSENRIFNSYAGSVRRFITLGTPHNGTPLGGLLWSRRNLPVASGFRSNDIFSAMGFPIGEAHRAMSGADNDASLQSLRALEVNTHAITANWRPQASVAAETMNTLLRLLQSPNEYRAGVMFYDSLFGNQTHDLIVEASSQRGGLSGNATTELTGIAHSDLPFAGSSQTLITSSAVMRRVNDLLSFSTTGTFSPTLPASQPPTWNTRFAVDGTPTLARGGIRIIQPVRGLAVAANSGTPIRVSVEPTGGITLRDVVFIVETVGIGSINATGAPPYSTTFTLPSLQETSSGRLRVIVLARETETGVLVADTSSIIIQTQGKVRDMIVTPGALQLVAGTTQGIAQLQTTSILADNTLLNITKAAQGTEYRSLHGRATVSADGIVTGIGTMASLISYDTVLVKNGGIVLRVPVRIAGRLTMTSVRETNDQRAETKGGMALDISPNPASMETVFHFNLSAASTVHLMLHDALGRKVRTISDGIYPAGQQEFSINLDGLPSGIYFVRGNIGGQVMVGRLVVVR
jgi:hypothetical protein